MKLRRHASLAAWIVGLVLCLLIVCVVLAPSPGTSGVTIRFVRFEQRAGREVAVFRASNPTSRQVSYFGFARDEPFLYYLVFNGSDWETRQPSLLPNTPTRLSHPFTLEPHTETDFFVIDPTVLATHATRPGQGPTNSQPALSTSPPSLDSYGIVIPFQPGDAASLTRTYPSILRRISNSIWATAWYSYQAGWISEPAALRIGKAVAMDSPIMWVESDPTHR